MSNNTFKGTPGPSRVAVGLPRLTLAIVLVVFAIIFNTWIQVLRS